LMRYAGQCRAQKLRCIKITASRYCDRGKERVLQPYQGIQYQHVALSRPCWNPRCFYQCLPQVEQLLGEAWSSWWFDSFRLHDLTCGHPMSTLGFYLIHRAGLIWQLDLDARTLAR
jgi:hypothetical protein